MAWRNLLKRRFYSLVTIFGLSIGMTFAFLIGSYVWSELQVNKDLRNADNQYIIKSNWKQADMGMEITTLAPLAKALSESYPNLVENYYRYDGVTSTVSKGDKHFKEGILIGDSTVLKMYGFPMLHGDAATALDQPHSIVIPRDKALKYFGRTDVVGKTLTLDSFSGNKEEFMITGVLDALPYNSVANLVEKETPIFLPPGSMQFFGRGRLDNWKNAYIVNLIELKNGVKVSALARPITQLLAMNTPPMVWQNLRVELLPLVDFYRDANNGLVRKTIWTLTMVSLFILLMAIVNFVNISIGGSASRLKEMGVRRVLGSEKKQIIVQFLAESVLIAFFSMAVSLFFYQILNETFSEILGKKLHSIFVSAPYFVIVGIAVALLTGLLAGAYPAFILSSLPAVDSMNGKVRSVSENILFRRLLIASQFSIALFVFVAAAVITQQVNFIFNKDLGYSDEFIISVNAPRDWSPAGVQKMETIRKEMTRLPEVVQASVSYEIPNGKAGFSAPVYKMGQDSTLAIFTPVLQTDEKYADTYKIRILAGKYFHLEGETEDLASVVINEAAVKAFNLKNATSAVGEKLLFHGSKQAVTIVGVIRNFHFESMHRPVKPLLFMHVKATNNYRYLSFKIARGDRSNSITTIEKKWRELLPDAPFEYTFMDDTLHQLYQSEVRLQKASQVATILATLIVLLGILGMVSLSVARRTKELGIRKVLGATVIGIIVLFLREFLYVTVFAMLISFPLAILSMNAWLKHYAYRIDLSWTTFAWVGLAFGVVIVSLVSMQTYKAAVTNPVKAIQAN